MMTERDPTTEAKDKWFERGSRSRWIANWMLATVLSVSLVEISTQNIGDQVSDRAEKEIRLQGKDLKTTVDTPLNELKIDGKSAKTAAEDALKTLKPFEDLDPETLETIADNLPELVEFLQALQEQQTAATATTETTATTILDTTTTG